MLIGHSLLCPEAYKHEHFCFFAACLGGITIYIYIIYKLDIAIANSFGALVVMSTNKRERCIREGIEIFYPRRGESRGISNKLGYKYNKLSNKMGRGSEYEYNGYRRANGEQSKQGGENGEFHKMGKKE